MINWFNTYASFCKMPEFIAPTYWVGPTGDGRMSLRIGTGPVLHMTRSECQALIDTLSAIGCQLPEDTEND
jgi:hypothetical protein